MTETEPSVAIAADLSWAVNAAQQGDEQAFRQLYRSIQPGLLRYLQVLVGIDAEDVASETWLQVVRDLHTFRGDGTGFRRWAVTVGRHRALDHLRRNQRRPAAAVPNEAFTELAGHDDTERLALRELSTDSALALIATLPPDQAEAVLLRVVIGLDAESAAHVLGKRSGAVRMAAYRGLKRLHDTIDQVTARASDTDGGRRR